MGAAGAARGLLQNHEQQCLQTLQWPIYRCPVLGLQLRRFRDVVRYSLPPQAPCPPTTQATLPCPVVCTAVPPSGRRSGRG